MFVNVRVLSEHEEFPCEETSVTFGLLPVITVADRTRSDAISDHIPVHDIGKCLSTFQVYEGI